MKSNQCDVIFHDILKVFESVDIHWFMDLIVYLLLFILCTFAIYICIVCIMSQNKSQLLFFWGGIISSAIYEVYNF